MTETKQDFIRLMLRKDLLAKEFTGHWLGKKQLLTPKEIQDEIARRVQQNPNWRFES